MYSRGLMGDTLPVYLGSAQLPCVAVFVLGLRYEAERLVAVEAVDQGIGCPGRGIIGDNRDLEIWLSQADAGFAEGGMTET